MYELRESAVVVTINQDQEIVLCGDNSLQLLGWTSEEMMQKKITDFMDERKARVHPIHTSEFIKNGAQRKDIGEFDVPRKDNSTVHIYVYITSKQAVFRNGEHLITGAMWPAKIVDGFNSMRKQNQQMFEDIKEHSSTVYKQLNAVKDQVEGLQNLLVQTALANKSLSAEQKDHFIQIINEGSKDTNVQGDVKGDLTGRDKNGD